MGKQKTKEPPITQTLGEIIREARIEQGFTQRDMANRLGCSYPSLCLMESNKERPSNKMIMKLATELGVDPLQLIIRANVMKFEDVMRKLPNEQLKTAAAGFAKDFYTVYPKGMTGSEGKTK